MSQRQRYSGGVVSNTPVEPTGNSAKGVWGLGVAFTSKAGNQWPTLPDNPVIGTAALSGSDVSVPFTPGNLYGATLTNYTVTSTPGCITGTGSSSPVTVTGLTASTTYTFKVKAITGAGTSGCSAASNALLVPAVGQEAYTTAGTYCWVAPSGVTAVSVLAVGAGGAGAISYSKGAGGGGGSWKSSPCSAADGAGGAVRIIWGPSRSFPSTNTGDL